MANEVQDIFWDVPFTDIEAGAIALSHSGNDTGTMAADADAATVQGELEGLASIGSGNVSVSKMSDRWRVTFQGALANTNVPQISISSQSGKAQADTISVSNTQAGIAKVYDTQRWAFNGATSGTFNTDPSSYNYDVATLLGGSGFAANLQADLDGRGNVGTYQFTVVAVDSETVDVKNTGDFWWTTEYRFSITSTTGDGSLVSITNSASYIAGRPHIFTHTTSDSPTEGGSTVTLDGSGVSNEILVTDDGATATAAMTATYPGWAVSAAVANVRTFTSDSNIASVTPTANESTALRKSATLSVTTVTPGTSVPTAPSSPSATALSSSSIRVAWTDNSSDETSFRVEVSADGSTGWTTAGTTAANATSKDITGLSADTIYYFRVFAVNGAGDSSATSTVNATTDAAPATSNAGPLRSPIHSGCKAACYSPSSNQG